MLERVTPSTSLSTTTTEPPPTSDPPSSPARSSRLRGLSYLRNYAREQRQAASKTEESPPLRRSISQSSADTTTSDQRRLIITPRGQNDGSSGRRLVIRASSAEAVRITSALRRADTANIPARGTSANAEGSGSDNMTRVRASSAQVGPTPTAPADDQATSMAAGTKETAPPTIRFIPHVEPRASRPALQFTAVSRTLKQPNSIVQVGRYSERDNHSTSPDTSVLPVGFKSKVVSRRHCEFWCSNGQWYVKDVKSSSGTFLNHVRLSSPGSESRPYPVNDGDIVQLGIDFKGGEEVIFRCVKIRIECNRGWQKSLNNFNTSAHKRILNNSSASAAASKSRDSASSSSDCSICLNPVAPCQALFVAPCSHVWHFKCIRNLIQGPSFPNFSCPNCRFVADLEADVEPPEDFVTSAFDDEADANGDAEAGAGEMGEGDEMEVDAPDADQQTAQGLDLQQPNSRGRKSSRQSQGRGGEEISDMLHTTTLDANSEFLDGDTRFTPGTSAPQNIPRSGADRTASSSENLVPRSPTPTSDAQFALAAGVMNMPHMPSEGPRTPTNAAGPYLLDGNSEQAA